MSETEDETSQCTDCGEWKWNLNLVGVCPDCVKNILETWKWALKYKIKNKLGIYIIYYTYYESYGNWKQHTKITYTFEECKNFIINNLKFKEVPLKELNILEDSRKLSDEEIKNYIKEYNHSF